MLNETIARLFWHRVRVLLCIAVLLGTSMATFAGEVSAEERGARPVLLILLQPNPFSPPPSPLKPPAALAHNEAWYEDRIFGETGVAGSRNVADYYSALSRGMFTFSRVDTVTVLEDRSAAFERRADVRTSDGDSMARARRVRLLAADAGFDYSKYDTNDDGSVTTDELTILEIDGYTTGSGATRHPGCLPMSGVEVCSSVSLAGHQSGLMNYAHELAHLLSPGADDLYGSGLPPPDQAASVCNSMRNILSSLTLMSCTINEPLDAVFGFYMEPFHRKRYGWNGSERTVDLDVTRSGTRTVAPFGLELPATVQTLTLQGPGNEAVTFEYRNSINPFFNAYDDGVAAQGLLAWFEETDASGQVLSIPTVRGKPGGQDAAVFSLAPVGCVLDPNDAQSRGVPGALTPGTYQINWRDGSRSGLIQVGFDGASYRVSWSDSIAPCGGSPLLLPPPLSPGLCGLLPFLCNPCGPYGFCVSNPTDEAIHHTPSPIQRDQNADRPMSREPGSTGRAWPAGHRTRRSVRSTVGRTGCSAWR
ncbi:hypothetical protein [Nocardia jinanensis]|uniref:EF-hand domain-containing protein n=1 Tax=Nocardia jinanensis TaxID=382504 RepID=A0A917RLN7_9NOCA|nr:hypothetical protein [Nocardia jinanensis]GGL14478.1 hypothetical protein GCM10011588_31260 [Nocardia jinanensis]